jgi:hypothetical protein
VARALVRTGSETEIPAWPNDGDPLPRRSRLDLRPPISVVDHDDFLRPEGVEETPELFAGAVGNDDDRRS